MIPDEVSRKLRERACMLEGTALLSLLCSVAMAALALAAAYLDMTAYAAGFAGASTGFFLFMLWSGHRSSHFLKAASQRQELNRRYQLRTASRS